MAATDDSSDLTTARAARRRQAVMRLLNRTTLHPWTTDRDDLADAIVDLMARLDREEAEAGPAGTG